MADDARPTETTPGPVTTGALDHLNNWQTFVLTMLILIGGAVMVHLGTMSSTVYVFAVGVFLLGASTVGAILSSLSNFRSQISSDVAGTHARIDDLRSSTSRLADREGKASLTSVALQSVIDKSTAATKAATDTLDIVHAELQANSRVTCETKKAIESLPEATAQHLMVVTAPQKTAETDPKPGKKSAKKGA